MTDISTGDARKNLAEILNRVAYAKERVVLTRHGRQVAALVPIEDLDLLTRLKHAVRRKDVADAISEWERGDSVGWDDLKAELGLK